MSDIQNRAAGPAEKNPVECAPQAQYDEALRACSREAAATLAAAVAVTAFFWGTLYLSSPSKALFWGFPLWFMVAVIGGLPLFHRRGRLDREALFPGYSARHHAR